MRFILLLLFMASSAMQIYAQNQDKVFKDVYIEVDKAAIPVDGYRSFYKWVAENMSYPKDARKDGIKGKVFARLLIDTDGKAHFVKILEGIGGGCDEEVARVLHLPDMPRWIPAKKDGKDVNSFWEFPVSFNF